MSLSLAIWSRARLGLGAGEPGHQRARHLALLGGLVDRGGAQRVGLDADLAQQREAARRGAGQHQLGLEAGAAPGRLGARQLAAQRLAARAVGAAEHADQCGLRVRSCCFVVPQRRRSIRPTMPTGCGENQAAAVSVPSVAPCAIQMGRTDRRGGSPAVRLPRHAKADAMRPSSGWHGIRRRV